MLKVRESGNAEFWVSHIIILLSTVLGVYLAALAGLKTAVEFEIARTDRESYFMRRALLDEVEQNFDWADKVSDAIIKDWRTGFPGQKVETFIWETMQEQSTTFQLSPKVLRAVKKYYDTCNDYTKELSPGGGIAGSSVTARLWKKETQKARNIIVPVLKKELSKLHANLEKRGITTE
jgi:hypothetical protein